MNTQIDQIKAEAENKIKLAVLGFVLGMAALGMAWTKYPVVAVPLAYAGGRCAQAAKTNRPPR